MRTIDIDEAKTHLSSLLEKAHAGEEIVVVKNGRPYARLCALENPTPRQPGLLKGEVGEAFFDPLPEEEITPWNSG